MKKLTDIPKEEWERIYRRTPLPEIATAMRVGISTIERTLVKKGVVVKTIKKDYKFKQQSRYERT